MNNLTAALVCAALMTFSTTPPVMAGLGKIDRACRQSGRSAATPQMCRCIQKVANSSLNIKERYIVSKWFFNPHAAQQTRQSSRSKDEKLWKRYKAFGEKARTSCG